MNTPPKATMTAWTHTRAGHPTTILSKSQLPTPQITSPTQVLVRISHCALNPGASIVMQLLPFYFRASPAIPEMDFAGTIAECGDDVATEDQNLKPGVQVFGSIPLGQHVKTTSGALAEYVVVEKGMVVRKPDGALLEEVAGLGIAGVTALELIRCAKLKKGDSVLVNGAGGGIGHLAVQMCRREVGETGRVVAVCSGENVGWVGELGCDEVIDYNAHAPVHVHLAERFGRDRFSAVIDAVGIQDIFNHSPDFLAAGKPYVTVGPRARSYSVLGMLESIASMAKNALWPQLLGGVPREYVQVTGLASPEALRKLGRMVEEKTLRVVVGSVIRSEHARDAYDRMLSGHPRGKIVIEMERND